MDSIELKKILAEYVRRFDEFDNTSTHNEGYKWKAVSHFQKNWNIDESPDSFLRMFMEATKKQVNLFDGQHHHPLGSIRKLLRDHDDYDFIHQQFSSLFSDDGGDLGQRQERAQLFAENVSKQFRRFYPTEGNSEHTLYDAINYLSFWRPEDNFICKPRSANKVANIIDFSGDIGEGEDFSLSEYYRMCNEILAEIDSFPELLKRNEERRLRESPDLDATASRHIIVYDVIYCAYQYNLNGTKNRPSIPIKERLAMAEARRKREEKEAEIEALKERLRQAEASSGSLPDLSGQMVRHKSFGKGIVQSCAGEQLVVNFPSKDKSVVFVYSLRKKGNCVMAGFISPDDDGVSKAIRSVFESKDEVKRLEAQLSATEEELKNLPEK